MLALTGSEYISERMLQGILEDFELLFVEITWHGSVSRSVFNSLYNSLPMESLQFAIFASLEYEIQLLMELQKY